jgi:hypothetical protein
MSWIAQITGTAESGVGKDAAAAEAFIAGELKLIALKLASFGHVGNAATFTGDHVGTINLLAEPAAAAADTTDALGGNTPQPPAPGTEQPSNTAVADGTPAPLEVPDADATAGSEAAQPGTPGYVAPLPSAGG